MRSFFLAIVYAMRDYRREALLSACSALSLAAVLAPLLTLLGVHHGLIFAMTERLLNDPRTLEVTPVGSGKYGPEWFNELKSLPSVAFAVPQTRSIAATAYLANPTQPGLSRFVCPIMPTAAGDPLLQRWNLPEAGWECAAANGLPGEKKLVAQAHFSESIARKLKVSAGAAVRFTVERVRDGRPESDSLSIRVLSVLPPEAAPTDMLFAPLALLAAAEDYRDGREVPFLGWPEERGKAKDHEAQSGCREEALALAQKDFEKREYASFRLYAASLDDVVPLSRWFQDRNIEVHVRSAEIENVRSLDRAFTLVFGLIAGAAVFGFTAGTASSVLAGVRRKSRSLGLMRLMGFSRWGILFFPIAQSLATGLAGGALACCLYLVVAFSIDSLFASSLPGGEAICSLPPLYMLAALGAALLLCALASLSAAWQATKIEPSEVIRDV